jgi:hypothetical protein
MKETLGLISAAKFCSCQAKHPGSCVYYRVSLGWSAADRVVLRKDDPAASTSVTKPDFIGEVLRSILSIDVRHRMNNQSGGAKTLYDTLAETAVDKELRWCSSREAIAGSYPT